MRQGSWTGRERVEVQRFAEEGLSTSRAAAQLDRSASALRRFASRNGIKFRGESGPPFGNQNRKGWPAANSRSLITGHWLSKVIGDAD